MRKAKTEAEAAGADHCWWWVDAVSLTVEVFLRLKLRNELILICRHPSLKDSILGHVDNEIGSIRRSVRLGLLFEMSYLNSRC